MGISLPGLIYLIVMIAVVITVDYLFLRPYFWRRLLTNLGIVLALLAIYLFVLRL